MSVYNPSNWEAEAGSKFETRLGCKTETLPKNSKDNRRRTEGAKDRPASEAEKERGLVGGGAEEEEGGEWDGDKAIEGKTGRETRQKESSHPGDT